MLKLTNVRKVFNQGTVNEKLALDGVNLTVEDGDFATIVGSNGAGKSTLFNCIGGSFLVDEGSIFLDSQDITFVPEYRRAVEIGRLFQDPMKGTAPHMTIERIWHSRICARTRKNLSFLGSAGRSGLFSGSGSRCLIWVWRTG